jgi:hypothetical protein
MVKLDKKIFDLGIGVLAGVFVLSVLTYGLIDMDNNTQNADSLYLQLQNTQNQSYSSELVTRDSIQQSTFNGSGFIVEKYQFIDTRGMGQGNIQVQGSQSTIKNFFNNASLTKWDYNGLIVKFILGLVGLLASMLILRLALGGNRV